MLADSRWFAFVGRYVLRKLRLFRQVFVYWFEERLLARLLRLRRYVCR